MQDCFSGLVFSSTWSVVLVPPGDNLSQDKALSCTGLYFTVIVLGA